MNSIANKRVTWITETAVMTALLIILQTVTKAAGQYVTGSCVNAVLAVSVLAVGVWCGVVVALLFPLFPFLSPAFTFGWVAVTPEKRLSFREIGFFRRMAGSTV